MSEGQPGNSEPSPDFASEDSSAPRVGIGIIVHDPQCNPSESEYVLFCLHRWTIQPLRQDVRIKHAVASQLPASD